MRDTVRFQLDGVLHEVRNPDPTQTVLRYLRTTLARTGTKEGCAEGDCGACTVVLGEGGTYRAVNACILFLPMIDGKTLFTVESLSSPRRPAASHPAGHGRRQRLAMRLLHARFRDVALRALPQSRRDCDRRHRSAMSLRAICAAAPATARSSTRQER